jgi:hypothetical protein
MNSSRLRPPTSERPKTTGMSLLEASFPVQFSDCEVRFRMLNTKCGAITHANSRTARTFPALLGYGAALATTMGAFEYTGGTLYGRRPERSDDEFERRTQLRTQWRTPGEQTLAELGEGRGM